MIQIGVLMAILPDNHKNLILDFDGVITHLIVDWPELKRQLNKALALPVDTDRHTAFLYAKVTHQFMVYQKIVSQFELAHLDQAKPSPLIQEIEANHTSFAIVSNNSRLTLQTYVEKHHLQDLCHHFVGCDDVTYLKPHPQGLQLIVQNQPHSYLYIGDQLKDQIAAKLANIEFISYQY